MANLTLVLTPNNKWIVFDTLMSIECSRAAIEFADRWFNENGYPEVEGNLAGIIISHSHVDHFGGIRGLFKDFKVDPSVPIYVPEGFTEAAISENLMVGKAMGRRAVFQYGSSLEKSPFGSLSVGIGQGQSTGTISFELPTCEITENNRYRWIRSGFPIDPWHRSPCRNEYVYSSISSALDGRKLHLYDA
ncbi:MBL fold metallo-hydrolase [Enterococcus faecium]